MKIKSLILKNWYKLIYILVTIIYIIFLKRLDKILLTKNFTNSIQLLKYDNYIAVKYFILAIIIAICGCWLIIKIVLDLKNKHSNFDDIIIGFTMNHGYCYIVDISVELHNSTYIESNINGYNNCYWWSVFYRSLLNM